MALGVNRTNERHGMEGRNRARNDKHLDLPASKQPIPWSHSEFLALNHSSRILRHSSNPVCGFSMMEQVRLCDVWPIENWLGSSLNQIQGWNSFWQSYSRALEQRPLLQMVNWTKRLFPVASVSIPRSVWRRFFDVFDFLFASHSSSLHV